MGNKQSSEGAPSPVQVNPDIAALASSTALTDTPGGPGAHHAPVQGIAAAASTNPGPFEELHSKVKELMPNIFDGAKVVINKPLSNYFQISHTVELNAKNSCYKFGSNFVEPMADIPAEPQTLLQGEMEGSGNLNAVILHRFSPSLRTKITTQIQQSKMAGVEMDVQYRGKYFTSSVILANPDPLSASGILLLNHMHRVTDRVDVGCQLLYQRAVQIQAIQAATVALGARYTGRDWQFAGQISPIGSIHLSYNHTITRTLQLGAELETNLGTKGSLCSLLYQYEIERVNTVMKGVVDSDWNVGAVFEKRMHPLPFTLMLSGFISHSKQACMFGIGFQTG